MISSAPRRTSPRPEPPASGRGLLARAILPALVPILALSVAGAAERPEERLREVRDQIARLRGDLEGLERDRKGVLGELARLEARARLLDAELTRLEIRLEQIGGELDGVRRRVSTLDRSLEERRRRLSSRLRGLYRLGPLGHHRLLLAVDEPAGLLDAARLVRQATVRDGRALASFRSAREERRAAEEELGRRRDELAAAEAAAAAARAELAGALAERRHRLRRIERDRDLRRTALEELRAAESALGDLVAGLAPGSVAPAPLDMGKFRGLLVWPAAGRVTVPYGDQQDPRFGTAVPHPGVDLDVPLGADIRAVFEGTVVFAEWFRGYGLTLILDHGGGYHSVYAHASVLLAQKGRRVRHGQVIGKVGDTGSLKGPYLYFEIRKDGRPLDPLTWLRSSP